VKEYQRIYEESIVYEDGDPILKEILGLDFTSSATIKKLRMKGEAFVENPIEVSDILT